jgi:hypothetical protein
MPTQQETPRAGATLEKLAALVRKRLRQLLRVVIMVTLGLVVAAAAFSIWWTTSLNGLPDIGGPFDVAAFRAVRVLDERNAFAILRQANAGLTPAPSHVALTWPAADEETRRWVEANSRAVALFQRAAEQADAANTNAEPPVLAQRLAFLVLLEGGRRQFLHNSAGAWDCYGAVLRMATHVRRRGSTTQRQDLDAYWASWLHQQIAAWADDPATTVPQIREALDRAIEDEPQPEWAAVAIKAGYLEMTRARNPFSSSLRRSSTRNGPIVWVTCRFRPG